MVNKPDDWVAGFNAELKRICEEHRVPTPWVQWHGLNGDLRARSEIILGDGGSIVIRLHRDGRVTVRPGAGRIGRYVTK